VRDFVRDDIARRALRRAIARVFPTANQIPLAPKTDAFPQGPPPAPAHGASARPRGCWRGTAWPQVHPGIVPAGGARTRGGRPVGL